MFMTSNQQKAWSIGAAVIGGILILSGSFIIGSLVLGVAYLLHTSRT